MRTSLLPRATADESGFENDLGRIASGDAASLSALYTTTVGRLQCLAYSILRCPDDAKEIVGDVFLFVYHNAHRYDAARGSVIGWLAVITRSRCLDRLRKRRYTLSVDEEQAGPMADMVVEDTDTPEKCWSQLESDSRVGWVLAQQSPLRRQLIALAFYRGLSHEEIAVQTGLPLGSVKSHIRRTLKKMRAILETDEAGESAPAWQ